MSKAFASKADMTAKVTTFEQLSEHGWAYTAEGDPNSGVIVGDDGVMVIDATATPVCTRPDWQDSRDHRQADKVCDAVALSRGARARCVGL